MNPNEYASFGKRLGAYIIDILILTIPSFIIIILTGVPILSTIAAWLYFALMESSIRMATVGKQVVGIIVTDMNGNRISFARATGRYFGKIISSFILCIGYLMAAWTDKNQALHDMMAGTLVLNVNGEMNSNFNNCNFNTSFTGRRPLIYGVSGEFVGKSFYIPDNGLTLGRDAARCQVIFSTSSAGISRIHCSIYYNASSGVFILTDAGSTYGTFHEKGMKLTQGQSINLNSGERFYLSNPKNMFEVRY